MLRYDNFQQNKYCLLHGKSLPLSLSEVQSIEAIAYKPPLERVIAGDAGDKHQLTVARFRIDIQDPADLHPACGELMDVINSLKMQQFYREVTGFEDVCIRRIQANILGAGDYVGLHIDGEGDSKYKGTHVDYKYAVVLHFALSYKGGDTVLHTDDGLKKLRLPAYSMIVITGDLPHEVLPVTAGERLTLVYFLSDNFGLSR